MPYREPGVYVEIVNNRPNTGVAPVLYPMIIGEGPKFFDFKGKPITRSAEASTDTLPSTKVTAITEVYTMNAGTKAIIPPASNYALTGDNVISWEIDAPDVPVAGATYYVSYEARPESLQYACTFISSYDELEAAYGGHFMKSESGEEADTVNPVALGAYLALESGAAGVYVIQIEPNNKTNYEVVIATDIVEALERAAVVEDAYFLVPMTGDSTAVGATITHCNVMSQTLERMERVCFVSRDVPDPTNIVTGFSSGEITAAAEEVATLQDFLVRTPFVSCATKILSDGLLHNLPAEYVCAALAGLASVLPAQRSMTRQKLYNFVDLKYAANLRRVYKNMLAEAGFIVLEQAGGSGAPITIRHGITTKTDNIQDREHSIVVIRHFVAKYLRNSLEGYIGRFNIDSFLKTKVNGTLTACRNYLVNKTILNDFIVKDVLQDTDNPDTLLINISVLPPYPCNYIDITLIVE